MNYQLLLFLTFIMVMPITASYNLTEQQYKKEALRAQVFQSRSLIAHPYKEPKKRNEYEVQRPYPHMKGFYLGDMPHPIHNYRLRRSPKLGI